MMKKILFRTNSLKNKMRFRTKRGGNQGLCDDITLALIKKSVKMGEEGFKNTNVCIVSFIDDPEP